MTPSLSQTWLGLWLLLVRLLVSGSITQEDLKHCSHMIADGHLQLLQQLVSMWLCLLGKLRETLPTRETEAEASE